MRAKCFNEKNIHFTELDLSQLTSLLWGKAVACEVRDRIIRGWQRAGLAADFFLSPDSSGLIKQVYENPGLVNLS